MRRAIRILVYVALIAGAAWLASLFRAEQLKVLDHAAGASNSRMMALFGGCVAVAIVFAVMCAYDVSRFLGARAEQFILLGGSATAPAPEVEAAERIRAGCDPLEAVRMLREFLTKHPHEWQVMIRIAEIYEHDLRNPLAAALEYEALLQHKLDPEQWSWSAIRLSNLYVRLRETDKAEELLQRIVRDYGKTSAAIKARKRLAE